MVRMAMQGDGIRSLAAALCLVVVATASVASARFIVEKNGILVMSPHSIRGRHEAAIANYGVPDYGGTLTGVVLYPSDAKLANGCTPFGETFKSRSGRPVVLLVDRGGCFFALKTWNAQQAGAAAVLVADSVEEPLLTMDTPEEESPDMAFLANITAPSALISKSFGDALRAAASSSSKKDSSSSEEIVVRLDWRESMPHPDARVEYEFWTNSNDECGPRCDEQAAFVSAFRGHAQLLEKAGDALFTPHYITWFCPAQFQGTRQCASQCINRGRYCAPDPEGDLGAGYEGKDVVVENLRQLCVHRVANARNASWVWWDFVADYRVRCSMKERRYSRECAEEVVASLGLPAEMVAECMGDPDADAENEVLRTEQVVQVGHGNRGDVTILPTLVINNVQYRGKLESSAVLKAICAGYKETTAPRVCLTQDMETDECLNSNGGCWRDEKTNITACRDTYRGRVCECPMVSGVQYEGDGYKECKPMGPGRCAVSNGGCWKDTRHGRTFSACAGSESLSGCACPAGFRGDGVTCEDVDECGERLACACPHCSCRNTWGGHHCRCKGDGMVYVEDQDTCVGKNASASSGWLVAALLLSCLVGAGAVGFAFYKYRLRSYMDSEVAAGHVQGSGVRVPDGVRRAVRGGRVQGVQTHGTGAVRGEQRRVLEGHEARQDLLRLRGVRVAQRLRVPAGVQGRRLQLRGRGRVRREAGLLLPALLLPEHLGRPPLPVQRRRHGLRRGPGRLRREERVGVVRVVGGGARAIVPCWCRGRWVRLLQVQAQELHGLGGRGDHVAVHASREPRRREPAAQGGGRGSVARQAAAGVESISSQ